MILSRNKKKISEFLSENFQFLVVKFSIYLNRRVFVMVVFISALKRAVSTHGYSVRRFLWVPQHIFSFRNKIFTARTFPSGDHI